MIKFVPQLAKDYTGKNRYLLFKGEKSLFSRRLSLNVTLTPLLLVFNIKKSSHLGE